MKLILLILLLLRSSIAICQIECQAPDSIIEKYQDDADELALRRIYHLQSAYTDSIEIPTIHVDSFLTALLAVYNATHIPERDTVISILDIHTFHSAYNNKVSITADSTMHWMKMLRLNNIPTGYFKLDSLIEEYNLKIEDYNTWSNWFFWHEVIFESERNLNIPALADAFEMLDSINFSEQRVIHGDGNDITDNEVFIIEEPSEEMNLYYSYKWGDCPAGCTAIRTWWFKIFSDCSVQFVDVFGSSLPYTSVKVTTKAALSVYPIPFSDDIWIEDLDGLYEYSIIDSRGRDLLTGKASTNHIAGLSSLPPGVYFLLIKNDQSFSINKITKL